ncbi:hypothetical protein EJ04DRAFT_556853 [Polyplosphaeria fusca]|uniref:Uncharacterized protein n=1 Tax=Polyplosphaeria fusca TaxID=682080 RepID=A0A9P4QP25_9PLEO|nr:hypothetical protein EJ04DRAFT_556853 [Polyplosphaeria fusca]
MDASSGEFGQPHRQGAVRRAPRGAEWAPGCSYTRFRDLPFLASRRTWMEPTPDYYTVSVHVSEKSAGRSFRPCSLDAAELAGAGIGRCFREYQGIRMFLGGDGRLVSWETAASHMHRRPSRRSRREAAYPVARTTRHQLPSLAQWYFGGLRHFAMQTFTRVPSREQFPCSSPPSIGAFAPTPHSRHGKDSQAVTVSLDKSYCSLPREAPATESLQMTNLHGRARAFRGTSRSCRVRRDALHRLHVPLLFGALRRRTVLAVPNKTRVLGRFQRRINSSRHEPPPYGQAGRGRDIKICNVGVILMVVIRETLLGSCVFWALASLRRRQPGLSSRRPAPTFSRLSSCSPPDAPHPPFLGPRVASRGVLIG